MLKSNASFFADDTKFFGNPVIDCDQIQSDLNGLVTWTKSWLLQLNADKCSVLRLGKNNPLVNYYLNGVVLKSVYRQVDLGVVVTSDLKWAEHTATTVKKANSLTYLIKCAFKDLKPDSITKIYKTYVRPTLEYAAVVWSPYLVKDVDAIERVQRRFTKLSPALRDLSYSDRLRRLHLPSLTDRRLRGDMIEVYKIVNHLYSCPLNFFTLNPSVHLRGHNIKLKGVSFNKLVRKYFFSCRVQSNWNSLPSAVVNAVSVNVFKNSYDALHNI